MIPEHQRIFEDLVACLEQRYELFRLGSRNDSRNIGILGPKRAEENSELPASEDGRSLLEFLDAERRRCPPSQRLVHLRSEARLTLICRVLTDKGVWSIATKRSQKFAPLPNTRLVALRQRLRGYFVKPWQIKVDPTRSGYKFKPAYLRETHGSVFASCGQLVKMVDAELANQ